MVRQLALDFLFQTKKAKIVPEKEETALAMAFILAESGRKGKAKLKFLSPITIPFWIVQISDTNSIVLSSIGESSIDVEMSEDTATGPVKRLLSSETRRFEDIPETVEKAVPLLKKVEPKVHHLRNIQEPGLFATLGSHLVDIDPNEKLNHLEMKIDSSMALSISQDFQEILEDAQTRHGTMEELKKITKEKLTDQLKVMENVITAEMARWDKRIKQQEETSKSRSERLQERLSDKTYRLRETHKKSRRAILAELVRDTVDIERFFSKVVEDIQKVRADLPEMELEAAVETFRGLVEDLADVVPTYTETTDSIEDLAAAAVLKANDLDEKLDADIRKEEESVDDQIHELEESLSKLNQERDEKEKEFIQLRKRVNESIDIMDGLVDKRVDDLARELEKIRVLTLVNDSINGLAPLTLLHIRVWVATYTSGKPVVFAPIIAPEDRIGLPAKSEPLNSAFSTFIEKTIAKMEKDSASFKEALREACNSGNVLQNPDTVSLFKKGIGDLWTRQLLKEGVREKLEPLYSTLVGRCPECKAEIPPKAKFCNECGKSLV